MRDYINLCSVNLDNVVYARWTTLIQEASNASLRLLPVLSLLEKGKIQDYVSFAVYDDHDERERERFPD